MDRLCLNAQCPIITTTTWPTPYLYYFSMIRFLPLLIKRLVFLQNTSDNLIISSVQYFAVSYCTMVCNVTVQYCL